MILLKTLILLCIVTGLFILIYKNLDKLKVYALAVKEKITTLFFAVKTKIMNVCFVVKTFLEKYLKRQVNRYGNRNCECCS